MGILSDAVGKIEIIACNYYHQSLNDNIDKMATKEKDKLKILYSTILSTSYTNISNLLNDLDSDIYSGTENLTLTKAGIIHY